MRFLIQINKKLSILKKLGKAFTHENTNSYDELFYKYIEKYASEREYLKSDSYAGEDKGFLKLLLIKENLEKAK